MPNLQEILAELKAFRKSKARQKGGLSKGSVSSENLLRNEKEWREYAIKNVDEDRATLTRIIEKLEGLIGQ